MPHTLIRSKWDSSGNLIFYPQVDDTGAVNIGDGTLDCDVKIFLGTTTEYVLFDVGNSRLDLDGIPLYFAACSTASIQFAASAGTLVVPSAAGAGSAMGIIQVRLAGATRYIYTYQTV